MIGALEQGIINQAMVRLRETARVCSLDKLPAGEPARVVAVEGTGSIARRLMEMGVVPGASIRFVKSAPLGDPLEIRVRGYHLALRRAEAQTIIVTPHE